MYKVSVVVPIHNVEKQIVRCAESLFQQTLDEIQFIFVDDASPDKSVLLLEQTLERFPQRKNHTMILHHPRNMGLPAARATGLKYVEAPYVAHCDSDDYVEPNMYEKLYECAVQNGSDMVICGRRIHCADGREYSESDKPIMEKSYLYSFLYGRLSASVWTRLTRTEIYRKVRFPTDNCLEDWVQTAQLLTYAPRTTVIPDCLYHYVQNPLSITNDMNQDVIKERIHQCIRNFYLMHDFIMERHLAEEKDFIVKKTLIRFMYLPLIARWEIRREYLNTFPEINGCLLFDRNVSFQSKMTYLLVLLGLYPAAKKTCSFFRKQRHSIKSKPDIGSGH